MLLKKIEAIQMEVRSKMKANFMNYFKDGNCYQWDKDNNIFIITPTKLDPQLEFCLDKQMMETYLKFYNPQLKLGKTLQVQEGKVKVNLKVCDAVLTIPTLDDTTISTVNVEDLKIACKYVADSTRQPQCQGVFLGDNVVCATDAFHAFQSTADSEANIIIPTEYISLLTGIDGELELQSNKNNVRAVIGDSTIIGRLIDGKYPTLEKIYSRIDSCKSIEFNVKEFLNYLSFSTDKSDSVILSKNKFEIAGNVPFEAELKDFELDCKFELHAGHFMQVLKDIKEEKAIFRYQGPSTPVFVNDKFLLLPIKKLV